MKLAGKNVLVTGGGSGIGRGIAECFAREGARVVIAGRTADKLEVVRKAAGDDGERILPRVADARDRASVQDAVEWATQQLGSVDILVNNAGTNVARRAIKDLSPDDFELMIDTNLNGPFYFVHAVLPQMRERGEGLIINISSTAGVRVSEVAGGGYSASKFGLYALSLQIGLEEGRNGIRSCMICPGEVNTPILDRRPVVPGAEQRAQMLQPEDLAQAALLIATLHPRATIPEMIITPTIQRFG
jgi:NAD(P)-dependent dehydrogenase (short-subunit alcohol dehydrogenase family)